LQLICPMMFIDQVRDACRFIYKCLQAKKKNFLQVLLLSMRLPEKSGKTINYIIRKICCSKWRMKHLKKKLKTCCTRAGAKYDTMSIEIQIERGLLQSGK